MTIIQCIILTTVDMTKQVINPTKILDAKYIYYQYTRLVISSAYLPLWVRLLPNNNVRVDLTKINPDKMDGLLSIMNKWFENLRIKEIVYEKDDYDIDSQSTKKI